MLMCMLIAIPLGFLHKYLPNATIKHLYSASLGLALGYLMIGGGIAHSLASCLIVYIAVFTMPASIAPLLTWIFSMGYLSYGHIVRMSMDDTHWGLEFTMFQMVLVAKQIMFAYNVADGAALNAGKKLGVDERSHSFQSQRALLKLPNLLEYLSYMFFFGGLVVGPAFEMKEYLDFTDMTVFKKVCLLFFFFFFLFSLPTDVDQLFERSTVGSFFTEQARFAAVVDRAGAQVAGLGGGHLCRFPGV
jgi:lysophospholipid acyltransferase